MEECVHCGISPQVTTLCWNPIREHEEGTCFSFSSPTSLPLFLEGLSTMALLETLLLEHVGFDLTEVYLPLPPSGGIKGVCHQTYVCNLFLVLLGQGCRIF